MLNLAIFHSRLVEYDWCSIEVRRKREKKGFFQEKLGQRKAFKRQKTVGSRLTYYYLLRDFVGKSPAEAVTVVFCKKNSFISFSRSLEESFQTIKFLQNVRKEKEFFIIVKAVLRIIY